MNGQLITHDERNRNSKRRDPLQGLLAVLEVLKKSLLHRAFASGHE